MARGQGGKTERWQNGKKAKRQFKITIYPFSHLAV